MGSGYFPLRSDDESGKELLQAASAVEKVCNEFEGSICSGDDGQFDNAASDGGSLAMLRLAIRLIRDEVRSK